MLPRHHDTPVYLVCGMTDMRKSIDGLAAIVGEGFQLDPFAPALFVFCHRQRNKLKILHWETNGFWLLFRIRNKSHYPEVFLVPKWLYARRNSPL